MSEGGREEGKKERERRTIIDNSVRIKRELTSFSLRASSLRSWTNFMALRMHLDSSALR